LESISPALLSYLHEHAQEVVLDKSACVLVSNILGSVTGDVQPAMDVIASLAAAELHPGGKDGKVTCYYKMGKKGTGAVKSPVRKIISKKEF
jgi:pumilio family protein 6